MKDEESPIKKIMGIKISLSIRTSLTIIRIFPGIFFDKGINNLLDGMMTDHISSVIPQRNQQGIP
jgi:hypothetical protein